MDLNSNFYFSRIVISFLLCFGAILWIIIFWNYIIIGDKFDISNLFLIPILVIPFGILFIFQDSLNRIKLSKNGITIYKLILFKFKVIDWTSFDYYFDTEESGKNGSNKVTYLVKDKILVLRISEDLFKNYTDIQDYIKVYLENKGFMKIGFFESFKYYTKSKIHKLF